MAPKFILFPSFLLLFIHKSLLPMFCTGQYFRTMGLWPCTTFSMPSLPILPQLFRTAQNEALVSLPFSSLFAFLFSASPFLSPFSYLSSCSSSSSTSSSSSSEGRFSQCSPSSLRTPYIDQAALELKEFCLSLPP